MSRMAATDKEHPLAGAVICFTSVPVEQRTQLVNIAKEMGARERPDLTSEVTHLLVGATDSPKYKFVARERNDVVVLKPEWIEAVRDSWMQGEDTDVRALEAQYKLPTFYGLTICITGFSDMAFRTKMNDSAIENGAEFRRDLTKSVTHLIARSAEGEKYKFAVQWNIKVVTVQWFNDCLERGMILDEEKYHPLLPFEQQGVGAWIRPLLANERKVAVQKGATQDGSSDPRPRKKLRRTASTKLIDQNENIWGDIIGAGFLNTETATSNDEAQDPVAHKTRPIIQVGKSFASETTFNENMDSHTQPIPVPKPPEGFLDGCYFFVHGFNPKQTCIVQRHLELNGAQLVEAMCDFFRPSIPKTGQGLYIMVPYQTPRTDIPSTDDMAFECEVVTDMWLEKCLHARALIPPECHVASTPFPRFPIQGFAGMRICSTGFAGVDLLHVSKLVVLMGASYDEVLTPKASVLLCNDPQSANAEKLRHIREWRVPAVSADWLWISIQTGQKKPFEPYMIRRQTSQTKGSLEKPSAAFHNEDRSPQQADKRPDGKHMNFVGANTSEKPGKVLLGKRDWAQAMPIAGDGFSNEEHFNPPKPTVPESRSPSPERTTDKAIAEGPAPKPSEPGQAASPALPSALDTALKDLLHQAQAAKARRKSENTNSNDDTGYPPRRKRRPLLGRAPSHSSTKLLDAAGPASCASSIDTLNDDGLGTAFDSANQTRDNSLSRANSHKDQSLASMLSGSNFDFLTDHLPSHAENDEDEENHEPQMTQLGYEDADAAAMRAEFLRDAGKLTGKAQQAEPGLQLGEVREMEDIGWGSGRRTRRHAPKPDEA